MRECWTSWPIWRMPKHCRSISRFDHASLIRWVLLESAKRLWIDNKVFACCSLLKRGKSPRAAKNPALPWANERLLVPWARDCFEKHKT